VLRREEVPAGLHLGNRVEPNRAVVGRHRAAQLGDGLQHLQIGDHLLVRERQPAFEPTGRMDADRGAGQHAAPQAELGLVRGLRIRHVGRTSRARAPGQADVAGQLA
jgi:hypothetical protein